MCTAFDRNGLSDFINYEDLVRYSNARTSILSINQVRTLYGSLYESSIIEKSVYLGTDQNFDPGVKGEGWYVDQYRYQNMGTASLWNPTMLIGFSWIGSIPIEPATFVGRIEIEFDVTLRGARTYSGNPVGPALANPARDYDVVEGKEFFRQRLSNDPYGDRCGPVETSAAVPI